MKTFEKICSDSWRPYGSNYKKIFDNLRKEGFDPFAFNERKVKINDYRKVNCPEVDAIYLTTMIEDFLRKKTTKIFGNMQTDYFFDYEYSELQKKEDEEGIKRYKEEKEDDNFLKTKYFDSNKKISMANSQWYHFMKRFIKEFDIDINEIKFFSIIYDGIPVASYNRQSEILMKNKNILLYAVEHNASLPEIESLINLGANVMSIAKIKTDFGVKEENFFLEFLNDKTTSIFRKCRFLEAMLKIEPELLHLKTNSLFGGTDSIFNILNAMTFSEKEALHNVIYERFKDLMDKIILNPVTCDKGYILKENNLKDYLLNNSPEVRAKIEKETINALLNNENSTSFKRRI